MNIINKINDFIEMNTNGLIKDIIKSDTISNDTIIVLINTLYFKIEWKK